MKKPRPARHLPGRGLRPQRRIQPTKRVFLEDCLRGIIAKKSEGREGNFTPILIYEMQTAFRDDYFMNLNARQVSYLLKKIEQRGLLEREFHHRDRTARHWQDQVTRYKLTG